MADKLKLGFLSSHGGSNMQAIIDACKSDKLGAITAVVISNNSGSMALSRAKEEGIAACHLSSKTHPEPEELDGRSVGDMLIFPRFSGHGVKQHYSSSHTPTGF